MNKRFQHPDQRRSLTTRGLAAIALSWGIAAGAAAQPMPGMPMPAPARPPAAKRPPSPLPVAKRAPSRPAALPAASPQAVTHKSDVDPGPNSSPKALTPKPTATMAPMPGMTPAALSPKTDDMKAMPGITGPNAAATASRPGAAMAPMQGGRPPADARNSFDYAGGYQRSSMPGAEASDGVRLGAIFIEQLEAVETDDGSGSAWDVQAWYGGPFDKAWLRSQGDRRGGKTETASVEALWFRMYHPFWGTQAGVRQDFGEGPNRTWAALGVQGVAPYWYAVEATAYLGDGGRTAARFKVASDLRVTQRLVLRPDLEANLYGRSDPARRLGSGLSSAQVGVRLRYELRREIAPYVGVAWNHGFGRTADLRRASAGANDEVQWVVGLQLWR